MKNSIKYLLLSAAALAAVSCESWLDVTPPSEIRAEAHYSSAEVFQQTLIGCYLAMGETDLYGGGGRTIFSCCRGRISDRIR